MEFLALVFSVIAITNSLVIGTMLISRTKELEKTIDRVKEVVAYSGPLFGVKLEEGATRVVSNTNSWDDYDES